MRYRWAGAADADAGGGSHFFGRQGNTEPEGAELRGRDLSTYSTSMFATAVARQSVYMLRRP